ncbi:hypothetical protein HYH02_001514 [Chlamydomonas schloesseri]|uniref:BACK domain-containing protein n=1 Tax=Chlamydomonas schloesseri TaxID=2026947 RepID=A0A835WVN3_9CHLO|nr:hypothetical protein HYH02_001514 [Chlamydomonas schloesseri]|eukprot:KAG2454496.1 hypothetical protein HYH02_001514 [Chlamydomonas schloesseri]
MAASVLAALEKLYASSEYADCVISVYAASGTASDEPVATLPGHLHVLLAGSELFQAQAERWPQQCDIARSCKVCGEARGASGGSGSSGESIDRGAAVLRVSLDHRSDLPYALSALRFLYSGKLDHVTAESAQTHTDGTTATGGGVAAGGSIDAAAPGTPGASRSGSPVRGDGGDGATSTSGATGDGGQGSVSTCSGTASGGSGSLAAALLHTRRLALYLQMPDCVAACEQALVERVLRRDGQAPPAKGKLAGVVATSDPRFAAVADVHGVRELLAPPLLLPPEDEPPLPTHLPCVGREASAADPRAAELGYRVRLACLEQLVSWAMDNISAVAEENLQQHAKWRTQQQQQQKGVGEAPPSAASEPAVPQPPAFGELLAWAAVSAPHALTNPEAKKAVLQLPAAALEALLLADNFATDDESSVLLLLIEWRHVNTRESDSTNQLLQRLVRLGHMNAAYCGVLLPLLVEARWISLERMEVGLIAQCAGAGLAARWRICQSAGNWRCVRDGARWFHPSPRPQAPSRLVDYSVDPAALTAASRGEVGCASRFAQKKLVASGFEWSAGVRCDPRAPASEAAAAGVYLWCHVPHSLACVARKQESSYSYIQPSSYVLLAHPGAMTVTVFGKAGAKACNGTAASTGAGTSPKWAPAFRMACGEGDFAQCGQGWGEARVLPLVAGEAGPGPVQGQQGQSAGELAAWERYMLDGKLRGQLRWEA